MELPEKYRSRVAEALPGVTVQTAELNSDGLLNDVVIVNGEYVFRFPKQEYAAKQLPVEAKLLEFLADKITLQIPKPTFVAEDVMAYRLIPGETLRRDWLLKLSEDEQQKIADQLAEFFRELHGVDASTASFEIPPADAMVGFDRWSKVYDRIREKSFPC